MPRQKFKYSIEIFWSDEDEGFIALVPDLAGCSAWGETEAEALLEAQDATKAWIKAAKKIDRTIPKPTLANHCNSARYVSSNQLK